MITLQYLFDRVQGVYNDNKLTVVEKIYGFKDVMYDSFRLEPFILRNLWHIQLEGTISSLSEELLEKINELSKKTLRMIADVYEEGVRQGEFKEGTGIVHADIIWGIFTGVVFWEESKKTINSRKDFLKPTLDKAFDIFIQGIRKKS